jgi:hypothetical protein
MSFFIYKLGDPTGEDTGLKRQSGSFLVESELFYLQAIGDPTRGGNRIKETVWRFWEHRRESALFLYKLGDPTGEDTGLKGQSGGFGHIG